MKQMFEVEIECTYTATIEVEAENWSMAEESAEQTVMSRSFPNPAEDCKVISISRMKS